MCARTAYDAMTMKTRGLSYVPIGRYKRLQAAMTRCLHVFARNFMGALPQFGQPRSLISEAGGKSDCRGGTIWGVLYPIIQ